MHSFIVSNDVADLVLAWYQISNRWNKFIQINFDDVIVIYIEIMGKKKPISNQIYLKLFTVFFLSFLAKKWTLKIRVEGGGERDS